MSKPTPSADTPEPSERVQPRRMTRNERAFSPPGLTVLLFAFVYPMLLATGPNSQLAVFAHWLFGIALGVVIVANVPLISKLIGGILVGFRVSGMTSGPLAINWSGGLPSVRLRWKWFPIPGTVAMCPKSRERLERKSIIVLGCGVFALSSATLLAFILPVLGLVSANTSVYAVRLGGLILLYSSLAHGDGRCIYGMLKQRTDGHRFLLLSMINADVLGPRRPRDWDPDLIQQILGLAPNGQTELHGAIIAHLHARDADDYAAAVRYFDLATDGLLKKQPRMISWVLDHDQLLALGLADAISFLAVNQLKPVVECRRWLNRLAEAVIDPHVVLRAEGGVLLAEGSPVLARAVAREVQSELGRFAQVNAGWKTAVHEWLAEIIEPKEQPAPTPRIELAELVPEQRDVRDRIAPSHARAAWPGSPVRIVLGTSLVPLLLVVALGGWRLFNQHWLIIGSLAIVCTIVLVGFIATIRALGRLVCGRWAGYIPIAFFVGPLHLSFRPRWRCQLNRSFIHAFGYEVAKPPQTNDLAERALVRILGGTAGLIFAFIIVLVLFLLDSSLKAVSSGAALPASLNFLLIFLLLTLLFCVIALTGLLDGQSLRILFGGGPRARALAATDALHSLADVGERPRSWREDWIEMATANAQSFDKQYLAHLLAYFQALDTGDVERAEDEISCAFRTLEGMRKRARQPTAMPRLQTEAAFFQARYRGDVGRAEALLLQSNPDFVLKRTWLRAQAALLHASGETALAEKAAREALAAARHGQPSGIAILEDEWLTEMAEVKQVVPQDDPPPATLRPIKLASGWRS